MPRRGENIYKRKDGRWEGRFVKGHVDGKVKYIYVYAPTYKAVKHKLAKVKESYPFTDTETENDIEMKEYSRQPEQNDAGRLNGSLNEIDNCQSFDECFAILAKEWMDSKIPQWKQSSIVKYTNILNLYLLPEFSNRMVSQITRNEIVAFSGRLLVKGGVKTLGLSPKTVSSILSV